MVSQRQSRHRTTASKRRHRGAARVDALTEPVQTIAQDADFNRGGYAVLENGWAKKVNGGKQVYAAMLSAAFDCDELRNP